MQSPLIAAMTAFGISMMRSSIRWYPGSISGKTRAHSARIGGHLRQFIDAVVGDELALDSAGENDRAEFFVGLGVADKFGQLPAPGPTK